jgi:hypothetical protein
LPPFERAFEPSLPSFWARLWALDHPRVNHYKETFFFFLGRSPITIRSLLKKKRGRVFTLIFLYKTYYTKLEENEFSNAFAS